MRIFLVLVLVLAMALCACTGPRQQSDSRPELRVAVFGTTSELQLRRLAAEAFESLTGARVRFIGGTSRLHLQELRNGKRGRAPFDVVLLDGIIQEIAAREGLLVKAQETDIPQLEYLLHQARPQGDCGPAMYFFSVGILYNPTAFEQAGLTPPTSWGDFWRPELKGRVAIPQIYHSSGLDFVQAAARVLNKAPDTATGLKAAIDAIVKLEAAMVYSAVEPVEQSLDAGEIWMLPAYSYGAHAWIQQGKDLAYILPREGGFGHVTTINTVKGSPNEKLANKFIDVVLSRGFQYALAIETPFGPVRKDVIEPLSRFPQITRRFPCGEEGFAKLYVPHWETINALRSEVERYWFTKFPRQQ